MTPHDDVDREFDHEMDRSWMYRLGQVERQSNRNYQDINSLAETVRHMIDTMPQEYVPRAEHEKHRVAQSQGRNTRLIAVATVGGTVFTCLNVVLPHLWK